MYRQSVWCIQRITGKVKSVFGANNIICMTDTDRDGEEKVNVSHGRKEGGERQGTPGREAQEAGGRRSSC